MAGGGGGGGEGGEVGNGKAAEKQRGQCAQLGVEWGGGGIGVKMMERRAGSRYRGQEVGGGRGGGGKEAEDRQRGYVLGFGKCLRGRGEGGGGGWRDGWVQWKWKLERGVLVLH